MHGKSYQKILLKLKGQERNNRSIGKGRVHETTLHVKIQNLRSV